MSNILAPIQQGKSNVRKPGKEVLQLHLDTSLIGWNNE